MDRWHRNRETVLCAWNDGSTIQMPQLLLLFIVCDALIAIHLCNMSLCACAGNTCFLNCILQVLYYTPTFVENVDVLVKEMKATITDYNLIKTVAVSMNE